MKKISMKFLATLLVLSLCFSSVAFAYEHMDIGTQNLSNLEDQIIGKLELNSSTNSDIVCYDSYYVGDIFVCTAVLPSGEVEYAYNTGEKIYYKRYFNGILQAEETYVNDALVIEATEEQLTALDSIIKNSTLSESSKLVQLEQIGYQEVVYNGVVCYEMIPVASANSNVYKGGMDELLSQYPPLDNEWSSTHNFYCPYLSTTKNIIVRDIRNNYTEQGSITKNLFAGASVVYAAALVLANPYSLLNWLGLSISVASVLPFDATVSRTTQAKAYHLRKGETFDGTQANRYVTCTSEWGYDYFVVSNQGTEANPNFRWGVQLSPTPVNILYPDSEIAQTAADAYNNALSVYGCWPWG